MRRLPEVSVVRRPSLRGVLYPSFFQIDAFLRSLSGGNGKSGKHRGQADFQRTTKDPDDPYEEHDDDESKKLSRQDDGSRPHAVFPSPPLLMHVWTQHTSCSLSVLSAKYLRATEPVMSSLVPESWNHKYFQHTYEGPDDMPAHAKTTLFSPEVMLPLRLVGSSTSLARGFHEGEEEGGRWVSFTRGWWRMVKTRVLWTAVKRSCFFLLTTRQNFMNVYFDC